MIFKAVLGSGTTLRQIGRGKLQVYENLLDEIEQANVVGFCNMNYHIGGIHPMEVATLISPHFKDCKPRADCKISPEGSCIAVRNSLSKLASKQPNKRLGGQLQAAINNFDWTGLQAAIDKGRRAAEEWLAMHKLIVQHVSMKFADGKEIIRMFNPLNQETFDIPADFANKKADYNAWNQGVRKFEATGVVISYEDCTDAFCAAKSCEAPVVV